MKTQPQALYNIGSALKKGLALAAAGLALSVCAEEVTFEGGSTVVVPPSGTVSVSTTGQSTETTYNYYNPGTGQMEQRAVTKGAAMQTLLPFMLDKNYGVTFKPAGTGAVWAQLSGDSSHQLITISEPITAPSSITIDRVVIADGRASKGGGMAVGSSGSPKQLTVNGDMIFLNNVATNSGGALVTGAGTIEFTGNVVFDSNTAMEGTTGAGGAIDFAGAGQNNERLIFSGTALFLNNSAVRGGAIFAGVDTTKTMEFNGVSIFENNKAGSISSTSSGRGNEGGAIYVDGGNSRSYIKFNNSTSFQRNSTASQGGAIFITQGDVIFSDSGSFQGSKSFVFTRNVSTFATTAGSGGGGGISAGSYGANTNTSSVYFIANTSTLAMTGNVSTVLSGGSPSQGSPNAGIGGAIRAMGGVYLLKGSSEFVGNQSKNSGGAIEVHSGNAPAGTTYRDYGIIFNENTETYKYKIQINGNASFRGNLAGRDGGALYAFTSAAANMYVGGNSEFIDNIAGGRGGAIATAAAGSLLTLDAQTGNITFKGNKQQVSVSGTFTLANLNTILANTSGTAGYLSYTGGYANDVWFSNAGSLELKTAASNTIYFGGGVSSNSVPVSVTKSGAGVVIFGTNSVSDMNTTTTISAGSFILQNGARYDNGSGTLSIASGATLGGSGTIQATTTANAGASLIVGEVNNPTAQKLNFTNNLTVSSGTIKLDLFDTAGTYDSIAIDTGKTLTATGINYVDVTALGSSTYNIITAGGVNAAASNFQLRTYGGALTQRNQGSTISVVGNNVVINGVMNNLATTWNSTAGIWRDGIDTAWIATTDSNEKFFRNGDKVTFTNTGAGTITIDNAGVKVADMIVDSAANYTFTGSNGITTVAATSGTYVTAGQKLVIRGAGTLTFENTANSFGEGIEIEAGTLAFNKAAQVTVGAGKAITFAGDSTLKLNADAMTLAGNLAIAAGKTGTLDMGANSLSLTGAISGAASSNLVKTGTGALTLTADSSGYAGATRIQNGSLILANNSAKLGGAITLDSGATLGGVGASTGSLIANAGSLVQVGIDGVTTPQNLTLNNFTMNGAKLSMDLYTHASDGTPNLSDTLTLTGAYTAGVGANTLDIQTLKVGTYNLGNFGAFADQAWTILIAGQSQVGARQSGTISNVAGALILTTAADQSRDSVWTGNSGNTWNISQADWNVNGTTAHTFGGGDSVTFDGSAAIRDISIEGTAKVSGMDVTGNADYTFNGGGIKADADHIIPGSTLTTADGKLTKSGNGTLTFNNAANNFKGGIDISGGALAFNNGAQINTLGAGIRFTGSGTLKANANGITLAENITIANTTTAAINTNGNNLVYTGTLAALGTDATFAKSGSGTMVLAANNAAYDGKTAVNGGTLLLSSATSTLGGSVNIANGATFGGIGSVSGTVQAQSGATLQVAASGATGTLALGSLALANTSSITGHGTLKATRITIGSATTDKVYANIATGEDLTVTSTVSGAGTLVKQGAGNLTLSGTAAMGHAATQIEGGLLRIGGITSGAQALALSNTVTLNGGWLDLAHQGSGSSNYDWTNITIQGGANAANGGVIGDFANIHLGSGTHSYTIGSPTDETKRSIQVYINPGAGRSTYITGTNNYTNATVVQSGTLVISDNHQLGSLAAMAADEGSVQRWLILDGGELRIAGQQGSQVYSERALWLNQSTTVTVDEGVESTWRFLSTAHGSILEDGVLTKRGGGVLSITTSATATISGTARQSFIVKSINLEEGTLSAVHTGALGRNRLDDGGTAVIASNTINVLGANTTLRIGNAATVENYINLNGNTLAMESLADAVGTYAGQITGAGGINKTGQGTIILTSTYNAVNTYSGETKVTQGTLMLGSANALSPNSSVYRTESQGVLSLNGFGVTLPKLINNGGVAIGVAATGTTSWSTYGALLKANTLKVGEYHGGAGSVLFVNWGLTSDTDYRIKFDRMMFENGAVVTGTTKIVFLFADGDTVIANSLGKRGADVSTLSHAVIDDNVDAGLHFTGTFNVAGRKYVFKADEYGDLIVEKQGVVSEWQALTAIDSQAMFAGRAALESLSRRFTSLRVETGTPKKGYDIWAGGMHREDNVTDTVYDGAKITSDGVQAGVDFVDRSIDTVFFLGATFDYISTNAKLDADFGYLNMERAYNQIRGDSKSYGVGLYGGMRDGPWYIEASMRASKDKYTGSNVIYNNYDLSGSSFGGSVETGYSFGGSESGWVFEPQAQIMMQRSTVDSSFLSSSYYTDGTYLTIDTIQSMVGRAGVKISKGFEYKPGCRITPYARGSILNEFAGKNKTMINDTPIDNDLSGSAGMLEFGVNARLSQRIDVALDGAYYYGSKYNGYTINGGIRFNW